MGKLPGGEHNTGPELAEVQPLAGNNQLRWHLGQRIVGNRQTKSGGQLGGNPLADQTPPTSVMPFDVITVTVISRQMKGLVTPCLARPMTSSMTTRGSLTAQATSSAVSIRVSARRA